MTAPVAADYLAAGDYESALMMGVGELLAAELGWTYGAGGGFPTIHLGYSPDSPDRIVALDTYGDGYQDPTDPHSVILLQLRFRGRVDNPLDPKGFSAAALRVLHNRTDTVIGGLFVPSIYRDTHANLGRDTVTRRWERTDNYSVTVDLPATANRQ